MGKTPKSQPPASISPRLQGYLTTAEEALRDKTKAPSQHAAARRVRDAILGQSKRVPASKALSPEPKQQEPVAALELPLDPHPPENRTATPETSGPPTPPAAKAWAVEAPWTRRWRVVYGVAGLLSILMITNGPAWRRGDTEEQIGMLLIGAITPCLFITLGFLAFDFLTQKVARREVFADISKDPIVAGLDIAYFVSGMLFFGLLFLSAIGIGPEKSNLFFLLPLSWVVIFVLTAILRR